MTAPTCLTEESLDDLLRVAIEAVLERGDAVSPTKGPNRELRGVTLQLTNPRARLSRSESRGRIFSALGELIWYLSGSHETDQVAHYIPKYRDYDEDGIIFGGYGPRLRGESDQLARVIRLLRERPATRRAVIQLFDSTDLNEKHQDVPCTCTLQFFSRNEHLDLVVYMRSNDVYIGLPHDVFCFTMIQELVARSVGVEVGQYIHMAGSLHLYDENAAAALRFLEEGFHTPTAMPPMTGRDPMSAVSELVQFESRSRSGENLASIAEISDQYWADLARLLVIFELDRRGREDEIRAVVDHMSTDVYELHIADRLERRRGLR